MLQFNGSREEILEKGHRRCKPEDRQSRVKLSGKKDPGSKYSGKS